MSDVPTGQIPSAENLVDRLRQLCVYWNALADNSERMRKERKRATVDETDAMLRSEVGCFRVAAKELTELVKAVAVDTNEECETQWNTTSYEDTPIT